MTDNNKSSEDTKVLKERNLRKNFDETQFIADIVLFFCKRSLDEIRIAKGNEEMTAVCNLYSMINLIELREIAKFNCNFSLIDEYRDIILKKTEDSLHIMGVHTSSTYQFNPYMVCTFTAACVDMNASELDRLGNKFTTRNEFKRTSILVFSLILVNVIYQFVSMAFKVKGIKLPIFISTDWMQLIFASVAVLGIVAAITYYFRRCIASFITEWKVKRRLSRGIKGKTDMKSINFVYNVK